MQNKKLNWKLARSIKPCSFCGEDHETRFCLTLTGKVRDHATQALGPIVPGPRKSKYDLSTPNPPKVAIEQFNSTTMRIKTLATSCPICDGDGEVKFARTFKQLPCPRCNANLNLTYTKNGITQKGHVYFA